MAMRFTVVARGADGEWHNVASFWSEKRAIACLEAQPPGSDPEIVRAIVDFVVEDEEDEDK
jgi:hypothetical protein